MTDVPDDSGIMSEQERLEWEQSERAHIEVAEIAAAVEGSFGRGPTDAELDEAERASYGENTVAAVPTCHAYNKVGQRCQQYAGHIGPHGIMFVWGDDECWVPGTVLDQQLAQAQIAGRIADLGGPDRIDMVSVPPRRSRRCIICEHRMHDGTCGAAMPDSEHGCDCSNGVEE